MRSPLKYSGLCRFGAGALPVSLARNRQVASRGRQARIPRHSRPGELTPDLSLPGAFWQCQEGPAMIDPTTLQFARRLARIKARQLGRLIRTCSREDLEQELLLEVVIGWERFDPARGKPAAFVEHLIQQKAWKLRRAEGSQRPTRSFDADHHDKPAVDDDFRHIALRIDVDVAVTNLPPDLRKACDQLRRDSVSSVARSRGVPRSTLDSSLKRVRETFRRADLDQYLS